MDEWFFAPHHAVFALAGGFLAMFAISALTERFVDRLVFRLRSKRGNLPF